MPKKIFQSTHCDVILKIKKKKKQLLVLKIGDYFSKFGAMIDFIVFGNYFMTWEYKHDILNLNGTK